MHNVNAIMNKYKIEMSYNISKVQISAIKP